jgi:hypothetical protein
MSVWLKGNYYSSNLEVLCKDEDHAIEIINKLNLDNPFLFDPLTETRQFMIKLALEGKIKRLDPAFYV